MVDEQLAVTEMCLLPLPRRVTVSQYPSLRLSHTPYIPNPAPELRSVAGFALLLIIFQASQSRVFSNGIL
jgi:hypothetical protein